MLPAWVRAARKIPAGCPGLPVVVSLARLACCGMLTSLLTGWSGSPTAPTSGLVTAKAARRVSPVATGVGATRPPLVSVEAEGVTQQGAEQLPVEYGPRRHALVVDRQAGIGGSARLREVVGCTEGGRLPVRYRLVVVVVVSRAVGQARGGHGREQVERGHHRRLRGRGTGQAHPHGRFPLVQQVVQRVRHRLALAEALVDICAGDGGLEMPPDRPALDPLSRTGGQCGTAVPEVARFAVREGFVPELVDVAVVRIQADRVAGPVQLGHTRADQVP